MWWIVALGALALVGVFFLVDAITTRVKLKSEKRKRDDKVYLEALGGPDNVSAHVLDGSRIIVTLKNYDLVDKEKLHSYGVDGFVKMSDRLVMVVKNDPQDVYDKLFGSSPKMK